MSKNEAISLQKNYLEEKEEDSIGKNTHENSSEFMENLYRNFTFFLKNYTKKKYKARINNYSKKNISRKSKIKKKKEIKKTQKKSLNQKSPEKKNFKINQSLTKIYEMLKEYNFKKEEIEKIITYMKINNYENINDSLLKKFPKLLQTLLNLKKKENINNINTRNSENFLTYLTEQNKGNGNYKGVPSNCNHVKICYFIWKCQGNGDKDPTAIGRKIKKMALFNQAGFDRREEN